MKRAPGVAKNGTCQSLGGGCRPGPITHRTKSEGGSPCRGRRGILGICIARVDLRPDSISEMIGWTALGCVVSRDLTSGYRP